MPLEQKRRIEDIAMNDRPRAATARAESLEAFAQARVHALLRGPALALSAALLIALCARFTLPLPFTPVPLSLQNFAMLLVALVLGSRLGAAALATYVALGAGGLPVFTPGPGGVAQLFGPTGGYLIAYPAAAFVAGYIAERARERFSYAALGAAAGNLVLFAGGIAWLMVLTGASLWQAAAFGLYPFFFAEVMKVMIAAALAVRIARSGWLRS
jgi:biotin transport system substrate-specific component